MQQNNYHLKFRFNYGLMDDGTIWIYPPTGKLFHVDEFTLKVVFELNSGASIENICKKYQLTNEEINTLLQKFLKEKALDTTKIGKITFIHSTEDISLSPIIFFVSILVLINLYYFSLYAKTFLLKNWYDGLIVSVFALLAIFFHELGHYIVASKYFKPKYGFTFLFIFPAIYVDTQLAWCLPKNTRILINASGCIADMIINTLVIMIVVILNTHVIEYFVTPFLITQYTRLSAVLNPIFTGDGYWLLSDLIGVVNLNKKGIQNLIKLKLNLYSLFGFISLLMTAFSIIGLLWFVFNFFWKLI